MKVPGEWSGERSIRQAHSGLVCRIRALGRGYAGEDRRAPLLAIFGTIAAHDIEVDFLQLAADRADFAAANGPVIDLDDWSDLRAGAAEENLVRAVQFRAINLPLAGDDPQFAPGQLDDRIARNAQENVFGRRGRDQFAVDDQEDVFSAALGDVPLMGEHDRLVIAIVQRLAFRERRIDIRAGDFRARGNSIVVHAPPGGDAAPHARQVDIISLWLGSDYQILGQPVQRYAENLLIFVGHRAQLNILVLIVAPNEFQAKLNKLVRRVGQ